MSNKGFKIRDKIPTQFSTLAVGKLTVNNINMQPVVVEPEVSNNGVLFNYYANGTGSFLYKAPDGKITFIANS